MDPTRTFVKSVKRIVIKVGTAVVTRGDGRLAVGRLGALCEQLKELNSQDYEVILVSSGAVGLGRQRLRYRRLANTSFADLQYMDSELDNGKACASVGQGSLMALYDTMFSQLDVTSSQLLVTDGVFRDDIFKKTLLETVNSLLALRVIPIFNENDAVSARRREPSADSTGTFWDNDSLAGILARELKADLLVLLSDVDGLYSGPPNDPKSKLIHTYVKEKHEEEITFGDKSTAGRGGMTAKVDAAVSTAFAGVPVVITSGFATDNVINVLQGKRIGTVFHRDASYWPVVKAVCAREMAAAAGKCCVRLQGLRPMERSKILLDIADALEAKKGLIKSENEADCAAALEDGYDKELVSGLTLDSEKITSLVASVRKLAEMEDPLGHVLGRTVLADGVVTEKVSCPFGVLLVVSESRPDALVQIAALAIRTGNGLLLKGETRMKRSNAILHKIILSALPSFVGDDLFGLVTSKEDCQDLLMLEDVIDLIIPRGHSKLVSLMKESTNIPVLVPDGETFHVYMDKSSDMDAARNFLLDVKKEYPAADYAKKKLIVHKDLSSDSGFTALIAELQSNGFSVYGGAKASALFNIPEESPFHLEFNKETWIIEIVEDLASATDLINHHGSAQSVRIITNDPQTAEAFKNGVDRAEVFQNGKSKPSNGTHSEVDAEVETASNKPQVRVPLGVEGLLTARWIVREKKTVYNVVNRQLRMLSL